MFFFRKNAGTGSAQRTLGRYVSVLVFLFCFCSPQWEEGVDWGAEVCWDDEDARLTAWNRDSSRQIGCEIKLKKPVRAIY